MLTQLQLFYASMGITFNVTSILFVQQGSSALTPTSPYVGIVVLVVYALSVLLCRSWGVNPRRVLLGFWILVLGYGGVIAHLLNVSNLQAYHSTAAWAGAIAINLFGLTVNVRAFLTLPSDES